MWARGGGGGGGGGGLAVKQDDPLTFAMNFADSSLLCERRDIASSIPFLLLDISGALKDSSSSCPPASCGASMAWQS
eukprot:130245-Hanusia_phi.AAC.1